MDGSFLSDERVIAASRSFVCIRLATYEDQQEADFMRRLFTPRSGVLENTTFAMLSPDGRRQLAAPGRGPQHAFRDATEMANRMQLLARQYPQAKRFLWTDPGLPTMRSVDVALNVAACDNLPVLVAFAETDQRLAEIRDSLRRVAWSETLAGQFVFAATTNRQELQPIPGVNTTEGMVIVEPGPYGLSGKVLCEFSGRVEQDELIAELSKAVAGFSRRAPEYTSHLQLGIQLGIDWESAIPETDPQSIRAKARIREGR